MLRGRRRAQWLAVLTMANLLLWTAVALGIAIVASRRVDLGLETIARRFQATAAAGQSASRDQLPVLAFAPTGTPSSGGVQEVPSGQAASRPGSDGSAGPGLTQTAWAAGGDGTSAVAEQPTPEPSATPLSQPLLVADPPFAGLGSLNAEMDRSAVGRPVQIRYQEEALNREVTALLAGNPDLPYDNVRIDLRRNELVVTGSLLVLGVRLKAEVQGTLSASACRPQIQVHAISLAGLMTPGFIRDSLREQIAQSMSWYPQNHPLCLEEIVLEDDRVTAYGYRR